MPSTFVLIDIFGNFEKFFSYLDSIPDVKERYHNWAVYQEPPQSNIHGCEVQEQPQPKIHDYEVIARIDSENLRGIRTALQRIRNYKGVEDIRVLPVVE